MSPSGLRALDRVLLRDAAYAALLEAIVRGRARPGERLDDAALAEALGTSRTPVREALVRLHDDGLVDIVANRYTRVALPEAADARSLFPVVAALDALAIETAAHGSARPAASDLRDAAERYTWATWRGEAAEAQAADDELHEVMLERAANPDLSRALGRLLPRVRWLEAQTWDRIAPRRATSRHHERLLEALTQGDWPAAAFAVRAEWLELGRAIEAALDRAG